MGRLIKLIKIFLLIITCFCSCKNKKVPVKVLLDYSYDSGWTHSYSIKVYSDGKAYLRKNDLKKSSFYVKDRINIDSLYVIISKIKEQNIANKYEDTHVHDAPSFNAIVYDDVGKASKYYVYGYKYPESLQEIRNHVNTLYKEKGWSQLKDTAIIFSSMINFIYTPTVIDTGIRILSPKELN